MDSVESEGSDEVISTASVVGSLEGLAEFFGQKKKLKLKLTPKTRTKQIVRKLIFRFVSGVSLFIRRQEFSRA